MDQLVDVILAINKVHIAPYKALTCGPGVGWLNQVYVGNFRAIEHNIWFFFQIPLGSFPDLSYWFYVGLQQDKLLQLFLITVLCK